MGLKEILGIIFLQSIFLNASAQNDNVRFTLVEGVNGEPLGKITCMSQDLSGYMWFAGEGEKCIYRYDGTRLTTFRQDRLDTNSLGGDLVYHVYADDRGLIWIGFHGQGLDQYNPATNVFTHYRHSDNDPGSIASDNVNSILRDRLGRLWIGTAEGLDRLDEDSMKFIHYRNEPKNTRSLSFDGVWKIYEDHQGVLWIGTGFPFYNADPSGGLNRMEVDGSFTRFMHDPSNPHSLINNKVQSIFEDSRGVFWVGTQNDGLHSMDRKTGKFQRHTYDPSRPDRISRPPLKPDEVGRANDIITFIAEDRLGSIWIGTMLSGMNRYDTVAKKITHYESTNGFPDNSGWNAFLSRDSVLWITTQEENLYRIEMFKNITPDIELGTQVHRFLEEKDGTLWVATENELLQLDKNKKVLRQFPLDPAKTPLDNPNRWVTTSLFQNQKDTIWVGSRNGLGIFDKRTLKYSKVSLDPLTRSEDFGMVITIFQDHKGFMWFTTSRKGLLRYNPRDGSVKWYRADKNDPGAIPSNNVVTAMEDKSGTIWVSTMDGGLSRLTLETDKFKHYAHGFSFIDSDGIVWAATRTGLYRYNQDLDKFEAFGSGYILNKDYIFAIAEDNAKNLWVTTPNTITKITADRKEATTFGSKLGVNAFLAPAAIYKTSSGEILVGHESGFHSIRPEIFGVDKQPSTILITDILINNLKMPLISKSGNQESKRVEAVTELKLNYSQNNLVLQYTSNDYRIPEATKYFTLLENYDEVWHEAAADRASYFYNLPPGKYVYRIKAYNAFGAKLEKAITIQITPPWWKTWWAYSIYGLFGVTLLYSGRREIVRRERLRASYQLEHLELEKAKEVDKLKSTFFANISHEFRTPLTLIKGPLQDLIEKSGSDLKTQDQLKLIQRNSDLLLKHINQLLSLAKLESGSQKIEATEFNLNGFIRAAAGSFSSMASQKNIALTVDTPATNFKVLFDRDKLETILINLINNAIKFTASGGEVHVKAEVIDKNSGSEIILVNEDDHPQLVITVKDNGIGIPEEKQAKIFERFYQVSEDHKEVGTGIGLSLVKDLAILLNGRVDVISVFGRGSQFRVVLPIRLIRVSKKSVAEIEPASIENGIQHSDDRSTVDTEQSNKPHVLVVEDNFDMRKFIIESLGDSYYILESEDGKQGLETAINEVPQLIVSDVMMPQMDGIEMTSKLKKDFRTCHIPVILLTAKVTEESKIIGLNTGADDYIAKPFNKHELLLKIRNNISGREKIRDKIRMELLSEAPKFEVQSADEKFLIKVKETIQNRLADEQLSVESLAEDIGLSRVQLYRKMVALTGISVNEMIRSFRLQKAAQLLEQNWGSVSQITYEVGFSNPSYFSKCFKDQFGVMPSEYSASKVK